MRVRLLIKELKRSERENYENFVCILFIFISLKRKRVGKLKGEFRG